MIAVYGNEACADCSAEDPSWAALDLGIFLCQECAQLHKAEHTATASAPGELNKGSDLVDHALVGTEQHLRQVRFLQDPSLTIDALFMLKAIGNQAANAVMEARLPPHVRATADGAEFLRRK